MKEREPKVTVKRALGEARQWYWSAKAGNGEIQAHGQMHPTRWNAKRAWETFLTVTCVALLRQMGWTVTPPTRCADCGKVFDGPSAFEDEDICPKCGAEYAKEACQREGGATCALKWT